MLLGSLGHSIIPFCCWHLCWIMMVVILSIRSSFPPSFRNFSNAFALSSLRRGPWHSITYYIVIPSSSSMPSCAFQRVDSLAAIECSRETILIFHDPDPFLGPILHCLLASFQIDTQTNIMTSKRQRDERGRMNDTGRLYAGEQGRSNQSMLYKLQSIMCNNKRIAIIVNNKYKMLKDRKPIKSRLKSSASSIASSEC